MSLLGLVTMVLGAKRQTVSGLHSLRQPRLARVQHHSAFLTIVTSTQNPLHLISDLEPGKYA
jgi:hypothetical protein